MHSKKAKKAVTSGFLRKRGVDKAMLEGLDKIDLLHLQQSLTLLLRQRGILREQGADTGLELLDENLDGKDDVTGKQMDAVDTHDDAYVRNMDLTDAAVMDCLDVFDRCLRQTQELVSTNLKSGDGRLKMPHAMAIVERRETVANWSAAVLGIFNTLGDILFLTQTLPAIPALYNVSLLAQLASAGLRLSIGLRLAWRVDGAKAGQFVRGLLWLLVEPVTGMRVVQATLKTNDKRKTKGSAQVMKRWNEDARAMHPVTNAMHPAVVEAANNVAMATADIYMAFTLGLGSELLELVVQVVFLASGGTGKPLLEEVLSFIFVFTVAGTVLHLLKQCYHVLALREVLPRLKLKRDLRERHFAMKDTNADLVEYAKKAGVMARRVEVYRANITGTGVMTLAQRCQGLQHVRFISCDSIDNKAILRLAKWCHGLLKFDVQKCKDVGDEGLKAIASSCRCLRTVNVSGCVKVTNAGVKAVGRFCRDLYSLDVSACTLVTGDAVQFVAERCNTLGRVSVGECKGIKDGAVMKLAMECNLHRLSLRNCMEITGVALDSLAEHAPGLRILDLGGCTGINNKAAHLKLRKLFKACPALEDVSLNKVPNITDETVEALAISCGRSLTRVILGNCTKLEDPAIMVLAEQCPNLKTVDLEHCEGLTAESVELLLNECRDLKILRVEGMSKESKSASVNTAQMDEWRKDYPNILFEPKYGCAWCPKTKNGAQRPLTKKELAAQEAEEELLSEKSGGAGVCETEEEKADKKEDAAAAKVQEAATKKDGGNDDPPLVGTTMQGAMQEVKVMV